MDAALVLQRIVDRVAQILLLGPVGEEAGDIDLLVARPSFLKLLTNVLMLQPVKPDDPMNCDHPDRPGHTHEDWDHLTQLRFLVRSEKQEIFGREGIRFEPQDELYAIPSAPLAAIAINDVPKVLSELLEDISDLGDIGCRADHDCHERQVVVVRIGEPLSGVAELGTDVSAPAGRASRGSAGEVSVPFVRFTTPPHAMQKLVARERSCVGKFGKQAFC
jgi:hypothetical protein